MLQSIPMWFEQKLDLAVRRQIMGQRDSAGFAMSSYADAEANGENVVFERALKRATDPKLAQMIRKHQEDEIRHADMIEKRREALGLKRYRIPAHLQMIDILSVEAGGILERPMDSDADVGDVYALLYVIEERAVQNFGRLIQVYEDLGDMQTAAMFRSISEDEGRHLQYCKAVGKRYAGSEEAFFKEVSRIREIEARVFARVSRGFLIHLLETGMLKLPSLWNGLLRGMIAVANAASLPAPTFVLA